MSKEDIIRKYALQNAFKYGKANPKALIGKVIGEDKSFREDMKGTLVMINKIVDDVNKISPEAIIEELQKKAPEFLEDKPKEKKGLKPLPGNTDNVIVRFEPSPSGPMHIGHAYTASLNYAYAKKYNGKFIFRIADTNPDNIYTSAYDLLKEDAEWFYGDSFDFYIQSDRMELYYKYTEQLIQQKDAYVCECDSESFRELAKNKEPCPCREAVNHLARWKNMFTTYKPGDAVVRFKSDITHKNPAMRDFPLMRINESEHPRRKNEYRVWPLMNLSVAVDDMDMKITHTLRAKDHMDNAKRQAMIHEKLGYKTPESISVGRINFIGFAVSASQTRKAIDEGKYTGWDDPRIPFMQALKRRGYLPKTFVDYAVEVGVTQTDKTVEIGDYFKSIDALNKSYLDSETYRFFFIDDPVEIEIEGAPVQKLSLNLHPETKDGKRPFTAKDRFYITRHDYDRIMMRGDDELFRLMDCLNFTKDNERFKFHSTELEKYKEKSSFIMHWLPKDEAVKAGIRMPDNTVRQGLAEKNIQHIKEHDVIQFERFGFCRKDGEEFRFTHK